MCLATYWGLVAEQASGWDLVSQFLTGSLLQASHEISEPAQQGQNMTAYPPKLNPRKLSISKISASPRTNEQILMKSHVTCFTPEQTYFYTRVHFCLVLIISGCKTFLPSQTSAKSGQLLGYEHYHTYNHCVLSLLGKLTFLFHFAGYANIIVDQNSTLISFLNTGDSFCWVQVLLLFHQHNSAAELKAGLGSAFFNHVNVILWQFSF